MSIKEKTIICIGFDGTIVTHKYPCIGKDVPEAIETMKAWINSGYRLILYTMRSGVELEEAVRYCADHGVTFWGINENPEQGSWTLSPKVYANFYVDDAAVGVPLIFNKLSRSYVDWKNIALMVKTLLTIRYMRKIKERYNET